jgi:hypothetical protein
MRFLRRLAIIVPIVALACGGKSRGTGSTDASVADAPLSVPDAPRQVIDGRASSVDGARLDASTTALDAALPDAARPDATVFDAAPPDATWICDTTTTGCTDCTTCSQNDDCKRSWDACQASSDCTGLLACIKGCSGDATCIGNCDNTYSGGVGLAYAYEACAVCACGVQCNDSSLCR